MFCLHEPLLPNKWYYIYNEVVGNEYLFRSDKDYKTFLQKLNKHISPVVDKLAWCLLPKEFHLLVEVKTLPDILNEFELIKDKQCLDLKALPDFIMERFSNCLNSYTKIYNNYYERKGSLFLDYCRRKNILKANQLYSTIKEVHKLPETYKYTDDFAKWKYSSFKSYQIEVRRTKKQSALIKKHPSIIECEYQQVPDLTV